MMNIFANENIYGGWTKKGNNVALKDSMPAEFFAQMDDVAEVTDSEKGYGKSVCFYLNNGSQRVYKALSTTSNLRVGDKVNKNSLFVTVLSKIGEEDIYRITEEA